MGQLNFSEVVEKDKTTIINDCLVSVAAGRKGVPADMVMGLVSPKRQELTYEFFDLPLHTFTPTTFYFALREMKEQIAKDLKEKIGKQHIWIHDIKGELREAKDEEVKFPDGTSKRNLFEGKPLTRFSLELEIYTWGAKG